ncbi:NAD(P)/FAD-dependent oxidoreductase [Tepidicaulis sp.]|uniref:NAD(P)/FAD-dependent oxidoreductase n=1 Tax=Tepidicaulis sp. TaxID=1920809 RepID=UPI003B5A8B78
MTRPFFQAAETPRRPVSSRKIAVIGSGISGLSAAWLLSKSHEVTLFEKEERLGGHAHTVDVPLAEGSIPVDTGFIVYNAPNYPNLVKLFAHLGVPTAESNMSFAASLENGAFEYSGSGMKGLFADRRNVLRPRMWRMIRDILKLYRAGPRLAGDLSLAEQPLRVFLEAHGYSRSFQRDHLLPMCAAIWSLPVEQVEQYPALAFLRFFENHGLMRIKDRPMWRTVAGGSRTYVEALAGDMQADVRLGARIERVTRTDLGVLVHSAKHGREPFDDVVFACHSDQALALLGDASAAEEATLGAFPYQKNIAYLHSDTRFMPANRKVWSSWNYMGGEGEAVCVTYWMNQLQSLPTKTPVLVTLNPSAAPREDQVFGRFEYDHPVFNRHALRNQRALWQLQGVRNTWFCGAYFGAGFHEDGLQAGLAVAEQLGGVMRPWHLKNPSSRLLLPPEAPAPERQAEAA